MTKICFFTLLCLSQLLHGCLTPMKQDEVERLTTCKINDFHKIRDNLLRAGYQIEQQTDKDLQTKVRDIKETSSGKESHRLTIMKRDGQGIKILVRVVDTNYDYGSRLSIGAARGVGPRSAAGAGVSFGLGEPSGRSFEDEEEYYEEHRQEYIDLKKKVCGE